MCCLRAATGLYLAFFVSVIVLLLGPATFSAVFVRSFFLRTSIRNPVLLRECHLWLGSLLAAVALLAPYFLEPFFFSIITCGWLQGK